MVQKWFVGPLNIRLFAFNVSGLSLVLLTWLTGCQSPTEPKRSCGGCTATVAQKPLQADTLAAQEAARMELVTAHAEGRLTLKDPECLGYAHREVMFLACDWYDKESGQCIAGLATGHPSLSILVSTWRPWNTLPLVKWESRNARLIDCGREDLGDVLPSEWD